MKAKLLQGWRDDTFISQVCTHFFRQGPTWGPLQVFGRRGMIWWCPSQLLFGEWEGRMSSGPNKFSCYNPPYIYLYIVISNPTLI